MVKSKFWICIGLMTVLASITGCSVSTDVTYIGSAGYMLESASKKVLIDAPFSDFVKKFEVPVASQVTQTQIASGEAPFNDIDLILVTHSHPGHFEPGVLAGCLKNNPDAKLVSTPVVYEILEKEVPGFDLLKDRIVVPDLVNDFSVTEVVVDGQLIRVSRAPHWTRPDTLDEGYIFNYALNLDGVEVVYALAQDDYQKTSDIDILFGSVMESTLEPKLTILGHQSGYEKMAALAKETSAMPRVMFLSESLQKTTVLKHPNGSISQQ